MYSVVLSAEAEEIYAFANQALAKKILILVNESLS
jgi:hypothetical protein